MKKINTILKAYIPLGFLLISFSGCDDFVEVDAPRTELVQETVFANDNTADAAMGNIYYSLQTIGLASGTSSGISLLGAFYSDEMIYDGSEVQYAQFYNNDLPANHPLINTIWSELYSVIYRTNSIIEGCSGSTGMSVEAKARLIAEAKFIRAFAHFYLVNLWGDVPLIVTTDYRNNNTVSRTPVKVVYDQIILDLQEAANALPADYALSKQERVRANKWAATALLARVYLYNEMWEEAETESTEVIGQNSLFSLEDELQLTFRATSPEAILQLWAQRAPWERITFIIFPNGPSYGAMRPDYVTSLETDDNRWETWGRTTVVGSTTYLSYQKYAVGGSPPFDYSTVFRLSEQYLIRAEARLRQSKLIEAQQDLNIIRARVGLPDTSSDTEEELFDDLIRERKAEFPTEWAHRWFDLKRWDMADQVLAPLKPNWTKSDLLFPIPESQIINNPGISQNPIGE